MKTRRSHSNEKIEVEDVEAEKVNRQPIIRTLRSRVITSDNEDEVQVTKRTPKKRLSRGKVNDTHLPIGNDEVETCQVDGEKAFQSPRSSKKISPDHKLFKITEISEDLENEVSEKRTKINVEGENSGFQEDSHEGKPGSLVNELIEEPAVSDIKDTVKEEPEISGEEKGRKKESVYSPGVYHGLSPRKTFGFIEEPMEDSQGDTPSPESSTKKLLEAEGVVEESEHGDDDGGSSDNIMTESISIDSVEHKIDRASLEAVGMQKAVKEPVEDITEDTSSSDGSLKKPDGKDTLAEKFSDFKESAETEGIVEDSEKSEDEESDDDRVTESLPSESDEDPISTSTCLTAIALKREVKEEKEQHRKKTEVKKEPIENPPYTSVLHDGSMKISKIEAMKADSEQSEEDGSDTDGEMPEAMSFSSGKEQTNRALTMAAEAIRKEKEKRKEQQKKRMDMINQQKAEKECKRREKLKRLEANLPERLDEEVICRLPDVPKIPTIRPSEPKKKKKRPDESSEEKANQKEEKPVAKKNKITKFDDYIPLDNVDGATKFGVVPLEVSMRIPKSASEKAAEFKRQALYGSRIKREPSKSLLMYKQKIRASGKDRRWVNQQQKSMAFW